MGEKSWLHVRKPEHKGALRTPRCRLEDNIKMYPKETMCEGVD